MSLPQIDLESLPGLEMETGLFGSMAGTSAAIDDRVVVIMVYVYEMNPQQAFL